ncbi:MAG TPA: Gfo/Idh/MocA family oxidoreductase, partial [Bacteroidia bacterium]|nr:Gfo/Idh/MocA family oxidoreductase [Bacteroidia bacterium]
MEENRKIKFAVTGSGHIGKRHAEMIRRNPEAELVAMCDIKTKSELGLSDLDVPFFSSVDEMYKAGLEFDVVNVCSPNGLHAEHTLIALEYKKNVVIEKPMGLTVADCEKIIFKALQVSRQVFCVMQNRYSPPSVWIKDVVDKNLL